MTPNDGGTPDAPRRFPRAVLEADAEGLDADLGALRGLLSELESSRGARHTPLAREAVEAATAYVQAAIDTAERARDWVSGRSHFWAGL